MKGNMPKNKKNEAKEYKSAPEEQQGQPIPTTQALVPLASPGVKVSLTDMFKPSETAMAKVRRLTLPPVIKPSSVGPGVAISGEIIRHCPSPVSTYKSELLIMRHESGQEFAWPVNAVTLGALATEQGVKRDDVDLDKAIGLKLLIVGLGSTRTQDGQRDVRLFEISVIQG